MVFDMEGYSIENFETIEIKPFWLSELDNFNFQVRENEIIEWGKM